MTMVEGNFFWGQVIAIFASLIVVILIYVRKKRVENLLADALAEKERLKLQIAILDERLLKNEELKTELLDERQIKSELVAKIARLSAENEKSLEFFNQRINDLSAVHNSMKEAFAIVSKDALVKNTDMLNASFKQAMDHFFKTSEKDRAQSNENLAHLMKPLSESLITVDKKVQELEARREGAYASLKEQIDGLMKSQLNLQKETQNLSRALSAPTIRGRWGEMQLKRVVELSGLSNFCDFVEQKSINNDGDVLRPDMIVTLPKNKKIVIDAKAPLEITNAEILDDKDENQGRELVASLKRHLLLLKKKSYHSVLGESPEFVVMFLPSEAFLHKALTCDPMLLDFAAQNEIIIATPITLVALLKAIAFGFKQEAIAENIEEVRKLSQQLIDRVQKVSSHFEKLGKSLKHATESYNQTLASLDSRVLVTARKLAEIKSIASSSDDVLKSTLLPVDVSPRIVADDEKIQEDHVS